MSRDQLIARLVNPTIRRRLRIAEIVQGSGRLPYPALAERFGVSERVIRRDMSALAKVGVRWA